MAKNKVKIVDNTQRVKKEIKELMMSRVTEAALIVEAQAKAIAPVGKGTGQLRDSITHQVEENNGVIVGKVGSPLMHAVYQEYGTGEHAENGKGRKGYWIYVEGSDNTTSSNRGKVYTYQEAKRIVAIMREKGLDAHMTKGTKPKQFLRKAFRTSKSKIKDILSKKL